MSSSHSSRALAIITGAVVGALYPLVVGYLQFHASAATSGVVITLTGELVAARVPYPPVLLYLAIATVSIAVMYIGPVDLILSSAVSLRDSARGISMAVAMVTVICASLATVPLGSARNDQSVGGWWLAGEAYWVGGQSSVVHTLALLLVLGCMRLVSMRRSEQLSSAGVDDRAPSAPQS